MKFIMNVRDVLQDIANVPQRQAYLIMFIVCIALLLDNMLYMVIVCIESFLTIFKISRFF
jgi:hypothetical protein